jgi:serine/threonine protein kinase
MEESSRRPSTLRDSTRETSSDIKDAGVTIRSRLELTASHAVSIPSDQLFALFTALAGDVHLSTMSRDEFAFEQIANTDVGIVDAATKFIGQGRSFSVRALTLPHPDRSLVLKSVLPVRDFNSREEQTRLGDVILELRALSHRPLRNHKNIVKLLGLGWETDSADHLQKWPVLIQECAHGTLEDLLKREPEMPYQHRLELSLGVSDGLHAIQSCGIVHGDLKPGNVLVFPLSQQSGLQCPWLAKLADFAGSVLDVAEDAKGRLPMRTPPWQAPEWAEYLTRDGLLRTDVFSLGLTIWSIMAKGAQPALNVPDTSTACRDDADAVVADERPALEDHLLYGYVKAGESLFAVEADKNQIESVLAVALRLDPSKRDLSMVCQLLRQLTQGHHHHEPTVSESVGADLGYSPVTQLSHVENLLVWQSDCRFMKRLTEALSRCYQICWTRSVHVSRNICDSG